MGIALAALAGSTTVLTQAMERVMYVSVTDQAGVAVSGLQPADFIIREDNIAREVLRAVPATEPMQIAVLVDTSAQAREDIAHLRDALPAFIDAVTGTDSRHQVALFGFGERPNALSEYTSDAAVAGKGVAKVWALSSGAYFVDAVAEAADGLKRRGATRPVILALVAEGHEASFRRYQEALDALKSSGASLWVLMLGRPSALVTDEDRSRSIVIDEGPRTSGGAREQVLAPQGLRTRLVQIADVLTHEYKVTYSRPQRLIPPERTTVAARNPVLTARGVPGRDAQGR